MFGLTSFVQSRPGSHSRGGGGQEVGFTLKMTTHDVRHEETLTWYPDQEAGAGVWTGLKP